MRRQKYRHKTKQDNTQGSTSLSSQELEQANFDINTNIGEGFGQYRLDGEGEILPFVTSANIACGAHAGDPVIMESALEETRYYGLTLGAHIGYPDLAGFGRREMHLSPAELRASILYQLGALSGLARTMGMEIAQVRPHGFLYRQMMGDLRIALSVARAVSEFDKWLVLVGPAGPILQSAGQRSGLRVAGEAWIDRTYDSNGHLLPHTHSRAQLKHPGEIIQQAQGLITRKAVTSAEGTVVNLDFQTIHVHAKIPQAKQICEQLRMLIPEACSLVTDKHEVNSETEDLHLAYTE